MSIGQINEVKIFIGLAILILRLTTSFIFGIGADELDDCRACFGDTCLDLLIPFCRECFAREEECYDSIRRHSLTYGSKAV